MESKRNVVGWFEIPVTDMERAMSFYEKLLGIKITRTPMGPLDMGLFPYDGLEPGSGGALVKHEQFYTPSQEGVLVYFSSLTGNLDDELARVTEAGGQILVPKKQIAPDVGYMALFLDTEGNRVALHSVN